MHYHKQFDLQLFNGNTVLETVYLLNATNSPEEYGSYATQYTDLIFNVLYLLANSNNQTDSLSIEAEKAKLFTPLLPKLMDMFSFEADLANVSSKMNFLSYRPIFFQDVHTHIRDRNHKIFSIPTGDQNYC